MLNKVAKRSVLMFGVVFCTTLFFGSVYAQSNSNSAQILFEMQAMRAEIADLRDMVERQQYELKKLKQRNTELESLQKESHASVKEQLKQLKQSNLPAQPNIDYDNPYGSYSQTPTGDLAVAEGLSSSQLASSDLKAAVGGLPQGQSIESPQNVDGRAPIDLIDQQQVMNSQQGSNTILNESVQSQEAVTTAIEQGQVAMTQGAEVVERGFNSSDLNQPVSGAVSTVADAQQAGAAVIATASDLGTDAAPKIVQNQGVTQAGSQSVNTQGNAGSSSPILAVPNLNTTSQGVSNPIDAGQIPQAPLDAATVSDPIEKTPKSVQLTEDQHYDQGFEYLKQSKYDEAIGTFNRQIELYPSGDLADDAHYWIAEAYFINRKPVEAKPHLKAIIDNYPTSARLPDAMLKTAYIEQDLGNVIEARILLQEIVARHPSSNAAIAARNRLENLRTSN